MAMQVIQKIMIKKKMKFRKTANPMLLIKMLMILRIKRLNSNRIKKIIS